eukprot:Platyproteum_vivax@DN8216_c0_g1_i1.p1
MGISRASRHKHRATGGRRPIHQKKRKFECGRPPANTKLGTQRIRQVRCRGGNLKYRALKLESGNFAWASEFCTRPSRILDVVYNASNNELVRTKTLVKNAIVLVDATPYKEYYAKKYGVELGRKKKDAEAVEQTEEQKAVFAKKDKLDTLFIEQFNSGRLMACLSSRPGQVGRADGYILEDLELQFYKKKTEKKKGK